MNAISTEGSLEAIPEIEPDSAPLVPLYVFFQINKHSLLMQI